MQDDRCEFDEWMAMSTQTLDKVEDIHHRRDAYQLVSIEIVLQPWRRMRKWQQPQNILARSIIVMIIT